MLLHHYTLLLPYYFLQITQLYSYSSTLPTGRMYSEHVLPTTVVRLVLRSVLYEFINQLLGLGHLRRQINQSTPQINRPPPERDVRTIVRTRTIVTGDIHEDALRYDTNNNKQK